MGTGNVDHRTAGHLAHIQYVYADQIAGLIAFAGDLLVNTQHSIALIVALTDVYKNIAVGVDAENSAGEQLLRLGGVAFKGCATLCLTDALDHHLLGGLCGDPAELLNVNGNAYGFAHLNVGVNVPGGVDVHFYSGVFHFLHSGLYRIHEKTLFAQIDHHILCGDVLVILTVSAVGVGERLLQTFHHIGNGNAFDFFQIPQAGENFCADIYLGYFRFLCLSCCHFEFLLLKLYAKPHQCDLGFFKCNAFFACLYGELSILITAEHAGDLLQAVSGAV